MTTDTSASDIAEIDVLEREIRYEISHPPAEDDQVMPLFASLRMRGPSKVEKLEERLRRFLTHQNAEVRSYAAGKLDALAVRNKWMS